MSDTPHLPWSEFVRIQAMWERDRRTTAYDTTDAAYQLGYEAGVQDERTRWQHDRLCNEPCAVCGQPARYRRLQFDSASAVSQVQWLCQDCWP